jgi:hypothetical protein
MAKIADATIQLAIELAIQKATNGTATPASVCELLWAHLGIRAVTGNRLTPVVAVRDQVVRVAECTPSMFAVSRVGNQVQIRKVVA